jgi:ABC-type Fe3+/spermidine/putrescine transport system ATPase subunit
MNQGKVLALGAPKELYENPPDEFVRDFLGKSIALPGVAEQLSEDGGSGADALVGVRLDGPDGPLVWSVPQQGQTPMPGDAVVVTVRLEDVRVQRGSGERADDNALSGSLQTLLFVGDRYECEVTVGEEALVLWAERSVVLREGDEVTLTFPSRAATAWSRAEAGVPGVLADVH